MSSDDFNNLCKSLQTGVKKALDGFIKWMGVWIHLPLSICSLEGNYGLEYASAFLQVFYSYSKSYSLTFLLEALFNQNFFDQFNNFANSDGQEP
ncbi:hypothetical protein RhiirA5_434309 [Rhizophagus irregularis]|uniref:Uncharacterized protein n=3 Tax=Rhizophagus irregularis TaxID=588596 RepID=U9U6E6_RHIID|nr:hypothetical protein GLOIN_2v1765088 [Rhizophagus irregularis DAOM 181602=DAOM 197198]PKB96751.1 hypothetical protein RhiirA5_434309 [Rhizophagus irregularis]POG79759.1 hypothetical protein GLOIN_2v1765088 [Rhizophagus irregularis DAOM 181602=DAOM 197198]CAG8717298.1 19618_t:CDS:2 [Rhizophagus irregularis]|eukprot:XP_025186625.1 hypothetical protein GLOIN_2v1765088 [Rhizophagus irregularis DAOM 181602=DAOM 197198]